MKVAVKVVVSRSDQCAAYACECQLLPSIILLLGAAHLDRACSSRLADGSCAVLSHLDGRVLVDTAFFSVHL